MKMMRKLILALMILSLSCKDKPKKAEVPQFEKVKHLAELNGKWWNSNDVLTIDTGAMTLQFNDGGIQKMTYQDDGHYFFINGYIGNSETFAAAIKIKKETQIEVDRIDGGIDAVFFKIK